MKFSAFLVLIFILFCEPICSLEIKKLNIGGIFDENDRGLELAFLTAVNHVNRNSQQILPNWELVAQIYKIPTKNSYQASIAACKLLSLGVVVIFGPQSRSSYSHVESICNNFKVPHIDTRWLQINDYNLSDYNINLYPHYTSLNKAYVNLFHVLKWKSLALIYQENEALVRLKNLFISHGHVPIDTIAVKLPDEGEFHDTLRMLKKSEHYYIIVDANVTTTYKVFKQAQQIGMLDEKHTYLATSLDMDLLNLEEFVYSGVKILSFRIIDPSSSNVKALANSIKAPGPVATSTQNKVQLTTEQVLMYDAVNLFASAFRKMSEELPTDAPQLQSIDCESNDTSPFGFPLTNALKTVSFEGLSGLIALDVKGYRKEFNLDIMKLTSYGLKKVGNWSSNGNDLVYEQLEVSDFVSLESLKGKTLKVAVILAAPYVMKANDGKFVGFCVDILNVIAKELGFNFVMEEVGDKRHGTMQPSGEWNGVIGKVVREEVDLAIGDITITSQRVKAVDFTTTFMSLGIGMLFLKPKPVAWSPFFFMAPFSTPLWISIGAATLVVGLILLALARFTPYEWYNPNPCLKYPSELVNAFTPSNALFFIFGSLMRQQTKIYPRSASTRILTGSWWIFTILIITAYIAGLFNFVGMKNVVLSPISSVSDLAYHAEIKYGCLESGSTQSFFKNSNVEIYKQMWNTMSAMEPSVFVKNNREGIERVKKGNYAFFMESTSSDYAVHSDCDLTRVGPLLDSKGYAFALPHGSPYRNNISISIVKLHQDGTIKTLQNKWWKHKNENYSICEEVPAMFQQLRLSHFSGTFAIILTGVILAILSTIFERFWKRRQIPLSEREPLCSEIFNELKLALMCVDNKTVLRAEPSAPSVVGFSVNDEAVVSG